MATKNKSQGSPTAPVSIGRKLNFAAATGSAVTNKLLEPHGLSLAQWAVLVSIWRNGPLSGKQIAELTGNEASATSRIIDRMVKNGLLVRQTVEQDRRSVVVTLTEHAKAMRDLQYIYQQVNATLLQDFSTQEVDQLFALLDRLETAGKNWLKQQK